MTKEEAYAEIRRYKALSKEAAEMACDDDVKQLSQSEVVDAFRSSMMASAALSQKLVEVYTAVAKLLEAAESKEQP